MRNARIALVALTAVAALTAACSYAGAGSPSPSATTLAGRMFLSTAVTQGGAPRPLVAGTRIRIAFDATTMTAQAGCNTMSGSYRLAGAALRVDQLATTEMGCDPDRHAQDEWLATFLGSGPTVALTPSALTLEGGGTTVSLVNREIAEPNAPLVGTTWRLESLFQGDTVSTTGGVNASVVFGADGRVAIDTGCNVGSASYRVVGSGAAVEIGGIALTKRACQAGPAEVEALMVRVLDRNAVGATISGPVLELRVNGFGLGFRDATATGG